MRNPSAPSRGDRQRDEQLASPGPIRTYSYPLETWEQVQQLPCWLSALDSTGEQFTSGTSSYETLSVDCPSVTTDVLVPFDAMVDTYSGGISVFSEANSASLSVLETGRETQDQLAIATNSFPITQALSSQTMVVQNDINTGMVNQFFSDATRQVYPACPDDQLRSSTYSTMVSPPVYSGNNMLAGVADLAADNTYMDVFEQGLPDSPTLGVSTSSEPHHIAGHIVEDAGYYQTPHFSGYPCEYTYYQQN